jgi:hypothetical protein
VSPEQGYGFFPSKEPTLFLDDFRSRLTMSSTAPDTSPLRHGKPVLELRSSSLQPPQCWEVAHFDALKRKPSCLAPSDYYPFDWIFPTLPELHAQELLSRARGWPFTMRSPLFVVAGQIASSLSEVSRSTG